MDVSDIFYFFSARGGGKRGSARRQEGGDRFLLKIPGGGGVFQEGEGPRGREGVCSILEEGKRPPPPKQDSASGLY